MVSSFGRVRKRKVSQDFDPFEEGESDEEEDDERYALQVYTLTQIDQVQ